MMRAKTVATLLRSADSPHAAANVIPTFFIVNISSGKASLAGKIEYLLMVF
ncbi:hypothetical protein [Lacticaseibacillus camelliae]|uniref:hypothetical protein n=1 Tax=Lacticaseibacillus camelliae TaxID=381742 RepID=UPI000A597D36|nr:hypothetical protein [Lacticaseibacillus camelliae]